MSDDKPPAPPTPPNAPPQGVAPYSQPQAGYPPQQGYPPQPGYGMAMQQAAPPQGYPMNAPGYPVPQQGQYPMQQQGHYPMPPQYPMQHGQYPMPQQGYGYPPMPGQPINIVVQNTANANAMANVGGKPRGSWGSLIILIVLFWPAAIFYYMRRSW